jgi:hypothetical protein
MVQGTELTLVQAERFVNNKGEVGQFFHLVALSPLPSLGVFQQMSLLLGNQSNKAVIGLTRNEGDRSKKEENSGGKRWEILSLTLSAKIPRDLRSPEISLRMWLPTFPSPRCRLKVLRTLQTQPMFPFQQLSSAVRRSAAA